MDCLSTFNHQLLQIIAKKDITMEEYVAQCMNSILPAIGRKQLTSMTATIEKLAEANFKRIRTLTRTVVPFL